MSNAMQYRAPHHKDNHISTEDEVATTLTGWKHVWLAKELRPDQKNSCSIFNAWVRTTFGSKAFLCAYYNSLRI